VNLVLIGMIFSVHYERGNQENGFTLRFQNPFENGVGEDDIVLSFCCRDQKKLESIVIK